MAYRNKRQARKQGEGRERGNKVQKKGRGINGAGKVWAGKREGRRQGRHGQGGARQVWQQPREVPTSEKAQAGNLQAQQGRTTTPVVRKHNRTVRNN